MQLLQARRARRVQRTVGHVAARPLEDRVDAGRGDGVEGPRVDALMYIQVWQAAVGLLDDRRVVVRRPRAAVDDWYAVVCGRLIGPVHDGRRGGVALSRHRRLHARPCDEPYPLDAHDAPRRGRKKSSELLIVRISRRSRGRPPPRHRTEREGLVAVARSEL